MTRRLSSSSDTPSEYAWKSIGDILGDGGEDQSGQGVALNAIGDVVTMTAPFHLVDNDKKGHARIFQKENESWTLVGEDIGGIATGDRTSSVAMNDVGDRIVLGAPYNDGNGSNAGHARIFENVNGRWVQVGQDIQGQSQQDQLGVSVDMNGSGTRVIVGAPLHNSANGVNTGHARIYEERSGVWIQLGKDLEGAAAEDNFGTSVAMSKDGKRVIIGAPYNDDNGIDSGHSQIFEEIDGSWIQVGANILGEAPQDWSGTSVDINSTGDRIIVGAPYNSNSDLGGAIKVYSGHARVYQLDVDGAWIQVGNDIDGESSNDWSGYSVAMSSNGDRVIIGAPYNHDAEYSSGHARVFQEFGGLWVQMGQDLDGKDAYDGAGISVDINSDGTRVAVGAPEDSNNYSGPGHVRLYELDVNISPQAPISASLSWWVYFTIVSAVLVTVTGLIMFLRKRNRSEVGHVEDKSKTEVQFPIPALDIERNNEPESRKTLNNE